MSEAGATGPATRAPLPVALDAMGGDQAPREVVRGALRALRSLQPLRITLVGRRDDIERELRAAQAGAGPGGGATAPPARDLIDIVEASEVIGMDEHPAQAVRAKRDASLVVACSLVAEGRASAAVSAGNSGAILAAALFVVKRVPGAARPALGTVFPSRRGQTFVLDAGANADCRPEWLAQFALMGSVYARTMMNVAHPQIGLLSNGEEPGKGSQLVQAASPLIADLPVDFVGNVEGKDLFGDVCDVAVTDGFTGNIALKTAEGVGEFLFASLREAAAAGPVARIGGLLLRPRLRAVRDRADYRRVGGALLLGVAGEVVIAHGRSDAVAVESAVRVARRAAQRDVSGAIARALAGSPAAAPTAGDAAGGVALGTGS